MNRGRMVLTIAAACVGCGRARRLAPIALQTIVTLGGDADSVGMATDPSVSARHPGGYRIVIPGPSGAPARPLVYGDGGRLLGQLQPGAAPDQQSDAPLFARFGPGDSIWVFDSNDRALVYDASRHFVRALSLPVSPWDAVILADDRLVIASANADQPLPLLLLNNQGRVIRAINGDSNARRVRSPRWIVRGASGAIWTMPAQFRWRLEHWDTSGVEVAALEREPAWFRPYASLLSTTQRVPPQPSIQGAWFDRAGRLWVLGRSAGRDWGSGLGPATGRGVVILDPDRTFDTRFEVFNPATARLVASARFDRSYESVVEPGVVMHSVQTSAGWRRAELIRVTLDSTADSTTSGGGMVGSGRIAGMARDARRGQFQHIAAGRR